MNFLRPEIFAWWPMAFLPIIIHLLNRRRYQRLPFGAMDFLLRAIKRQRRRVWLQDWLLLLLRTLAVVAFLIALAGPTSKDAALVQTRTARAEVLVLDASLSMQWEGKAGIPWERALQEAEAILGPLKQSQGDQAALILAGIPAQRLAAGDPGVVRAALAEQSLGQFGKAQWPSAIKLAEVAARTFTQQGLPTRVHLISDLQASTWGARSDLESTLAPLQSLDWRVVSVQEERLPNARVDVELSATQVGLGDWVSFRAKIQNSGPARAVQGTFIVNGKTTRTQEITLSQQGVATATEDWMAAAEGFLGVEFRLGGDGLVADNRAFTVLETTHPHQVALHGKHLATGALAAQSVRGFLDLDSQAPWEIVDLEDASLRQEDLQDVPILVLIGPNKQAVQAADLIKNFVHQGGKLLLLPTTSGLANQLLNLLSSGHVKVSERQYGNPSASLVIENPDHAALRLFQDPQWQPLLTEVPFQAWLPVEILATSPPVQIALSLSGQPALVEWRSEGGTIAVLTAFPDPEHNSMEQFPGGTLPFLFDLIQFLSKGPSAILNRVCGDPLEVILPAGLMQLQLQNPAGGNQRLTLPAEISNQTPTRLLDHLPTPGIWKLFGYTLDEQSREHAWEMLFAVSVPAEESQPATLAVAELEPYLPQNRTSGDFQFAKSPSPPSWGLWLFLLALTSLVGETTLAAYLDRRRG